MVACSVEIVQKISLLEGAQEVEQVVAEFRKAVPEHSSQFRTHVKVPTLGDGKDKMKIIITYFTSHRFLTFFFVLYVNSTSSIQRKTD